MSRVPVFIAGRARSHKCDTVGASLLAMGRGSVSIAGTARSHMDIKEK